MFKIDVTKINFLFEKSNIREDLFQDSDQISLYLFLFTYYLRSFDLEYSNLYDVICKYRKNDICKYKNKIANAYITRRYAFIIFPGQIYMDLKKHQNRTPIIYRYYNYPF